VEGLSRFLARVWRASWTKNKAGEWQYHPRVQDVAEEKSQRKTLHATDKKVTEEIESLSFKQSISQTGWFFGTSFHQKQSVPVFSNNGIY